MVGEGESKSGITASLSPGGVTDSAVAAHELKAPLAVIRQLALELENDEITDGERREISQHIELVAERSLRFVSNITRAEQLQMTLLQTSPINPSQLCDEVVRELQPLYAAHSRVLRSRYSRQAGLVVANTDLLRRILLNFGDNALYYGNESGVVELFMQLKKSRSVVRLGVRDYGPMVPADTWRKLQNTTAAPRAVHARPDSSGLGLKIVSRFADVLGGQLGAIRHRDGASFYVDMPVSRQLSLL